jgi:hypothetical protein
MQGYLFAAPMDIVAFLSWLQAQSPGRSVVVPFSGRSTA